MKKGKLKALTAYLVSAACLLTAVTQVFGAEKESDPLPMETAEIVQTSCFDYHLSGDTLTIMQTDPIGAEYENGRMYFGIYDGELLAAAAAADLVKSESETGLAIPEQTVIIPSEHGELTVKAFLWEKDSMRPMSEVTEVACYDETAYGVIVDMYQTAENDNPTVRMITSDAQVVAYECMDRNEADKFYSYAVYGIESGYSYNDNGFTKADIIDRIKSGLTVCRYDLSGDKILFGNAEFGRGGSGLEFMAPFSKLGVFSIHDGVTKIIDIEDCLNGSEISVYPVSFGELKDERGYDAYVFGKNNNGDYSFCMITGGLNTLYENDPISVAVKNNGSVSVDGDILTQVTVARGDEKKDVLFREDVSINEGDIISYREERNGRVEEKFEKISEPAESYDDMLSQSINSNIFADGLFNSYTADTGYRMVYNGSVMTSPSFPDDSYIYYGPVYIKHNNCLEIFTHQTDGMSDIKDVESFNTDGANLYVYDYDKSVGLRVSSGDITMKPYIYDSAYADNNPDAISWDKVRESGICPPFAAVKVVYGEVQDVVYYTASDHLPDFDYDIGGDTEVKNYAVVTAMRDTTVTLATAEGEVKDFVCASDADRDAFYTLATGGTDFADFTKADIRDRIIRGCTACAYTLNADGTVSFGEALTPKSLNDALYRADISKLGQAFISEDTKIICLEDFIRETGTSDNIMKISPDMLVDGRGYAVCEYDTKTSGVCSFAVITGGVTDVRADAAIAVVQCYDGTEDIGGVTVSRYLLAENGTEGKAVLFDNDVTLNEGDVISYSVGAEGYVKTGDSNKFIKIFSADGSSYDDFQTKIMGGSIFADAELLSDSALGPAEEYTGVVSRPAVYGDNDKDVRYCFGPVYTSQANTIELFTQKNDSGYLDVFEVTQLSTTGANSYVYSYGEGQKDRVWVGKISQSDSIFRGSYTDWNELSVSWDKCMEDGIDPAFALVRMIDDETTDVIYFTAY